MLYTLKIKLHPSAEQKAAILKTMERFNSVCGFISKFAFENKIFGKIKIQQEIYYQVRDQFKLSAQIKPHGAIVYDQRNLTVKNTDTVSFVTLQGRITVAMTVCNYYAEIINKSKRIRGQADLCLIGNIFYLLLVVDKLRQKLQSKGTKSAKRLLKKRSKKERRFATDVNHCISKKIVQVAKGTERGIALEDLTGIRKRTAERKTVNKTMRQELSAWAFYQLRQFIQYKARAAGVPVVLVDPRNTSRTCSHCGHVDKANRKSQAKFVCVKCGHSANADINAAMNIARRGAACHTAVRGGVS